MSVGIPAFALPVVSARISAGLPLATAFSQRCAYSALSRFSTVCALGFVR
jgi:hypothetical protein